MSDPVKILYVDDEQGNIDYFTTVFRREFEVLSARSGKEGLEILQENPDISIILTDQRMPRMTGIEFLKYAMDISLDPVRILVTGYADMETVIKAINQGHIFYYISKPWTYDEMKIVISRAIENYRLSKTNKELLLLSERKEKEMVITELESLRNQVNPHFLFNCLNTLRALVPENLEARDFISRLANIYRYMLEHNKDNLVILRDELQFSINYFYLQNTRFQKALVFENGITDSVLDFKIPSASLQILIENTIKHNNATIEKPLVVSLYNEDGWVVVKNNYQPRKHVVSTGIGHENLIRRYSFMTDRKPDFYIENGYYYSKIPLLTD